MSRSIADTDPETPKEPEVDLKRIADMLYAIFCAVQEINAKLDPDAPEERPVNGL